MVKRLSILLAAAALTGLLLLGAASWLFGTTAGARWALPRLASLAGAELRIGQVEGPLLGALQLREVTLQQGDLEVQLGQLSIDSRLAGGVPLSLEISRLQLDALEIQRPPARPQAAPTELRWPEPPGLLRLVEVVVHDFALREARWQTGSAPAQQLDLLRGALTWRDGALQLEQVELDTTALQGRGSGRIDLAAPRLKLDIQLETHGAAAAWSQLQLRTDLRSNERALPLHGSLVCEVAGTRAGTVRAEGELGVARDALLLQQVRLTRLEHPGEIVASGRLSWQKQGTELSGQLNLSQLDLRGDTGQPLQLSGEIRGRGGANAYQGRFDLNNAGGGAAAARVAGTFAGDAQQVTFDIAQGAWLAGSLQGQLKARWQDGWQLQAELNGIGLDPQQLHTRLSGELNLQLRASLAGRDPSALQGRLDLALQESLLHQQPLDGTATVTLQGRAFQVEQLQLRGQDFRIEAHGNPFEQLAIKWQVDRLEQLLAATAGRFSGQGWVRWRDQKLAAKLQATGRQLSFDRWTLESLQVRGNTTQADSAWQVRLDGQNLTSPQGEQMLDRAHAALQGSVERHRLTLDLETHQERATTSLSGAWDGRRWAGELAGLQLKSVRFGDWNLGQPVSLELSKTAYKLAPLLLQSHDGNQLRLDANWGLEGLAGQLQLTLADGAQLQGTATSPLPAGLTQPKQVRLELAGSNLPLTRLSPWLPPALNLSGQLNGHAEGEWLAEGPSRFNGTLSTTSAEAFWEEEDGMVRAEITSAELDWQWHHQLEGKLSLQLQQQGQLRAGFTLPLAARLPLAIDPALPISGELQTELQELGLASMLFPGRIQESRGRLRLDLELAGRWQQPTLHGRFHLSDAGAFLPTLGVQLNEISLQGDFADNRVNLDQLHLVAGDGPLDGSGYLLLEQWRPGAYHLQLQGSRVQLVNLPELQVRANPKLVLDGQGPRITLRGQLELPEVLIKGKQKTGLAGRSPDLVVLDRPAPPTRTPRLQHDIDIELILGEKVLLHTAGIDARLTGTVRLQSTDSRQVVANGAFHVAKGRYASYGVKLDISRGSLYFSGGPIDQPTLDILALRKAGEVQAGVKITGTPKAPDVQLYSEPALADTDILSYIVFGRPVGADRNQAGMLMAAAGALLSQGESVTLQEKLKDRLGLDVLDISSGSGDDLTSSIVTTGKYLSPDLYVSLGYSLFTNTNEVKVRYHLTPTWEIESNLGIESGVDMYYRLEFE